MASDINQFHLAERLLSEGDAKAAVKIAKRMRKPGLTHANSVLRVASLLWRCGAESDCARYLVRASERFPQHTTIADEGAKRCLETERFPEALMLSERGISTEQESDERIATAGQALVGLSRAYEAWLRVAPRFEASDNTSSSLHNVLVNAGQILGREIPPLVLNHEQSYQKEAMHHARTVSLEEMAGFDAATPHVLYEQDTYDFGEEDTTNSQTPPPQVFIDSGSTSQNSQSLTPGETATGIEDGKTISGTDNAISMPPLFTEEGQGQLSAKKHKRTQSENLTSPIPTRHRPVIGRIEDLEKFFTSHPAPPPIAWCGVLPSAIKGAKHIPSRIAREVNEQRWPRVSAELAKEESTTWFVLDARVGSGWDIRDEGLHQSLKELKHPVVLITNETWEAPFARWKPMAL